MSYRLASVVQLFLLFSCAPGYVIRAGVGQMSILLHREDFEDVLTDPQTSAEEREALQYVNEVREYAQNKIGLNVDDTYTTYVRLNRKAVAWNVTASRPYSFKAKTWWFPVVGEVPYLGFFSQEEAEEKAKELEEEGYDVQVSEVPAYSTLGWFSDPLLSTQIKFSRWYLTRLVIHESVHRTVWIPGDVTFNESFASFVETTAAYNYYQERYGSDSDEYIKVQRQSKEKEEYIKMMFETAGALSHLYDSTTDIKELKKRKFEIIESLRKLLISRQQEFQFFDTEKIAEKKLNNAWFLSYLRYGSGKGFFLRLFTESNGKWPTFFKKIRALESLSNEERVILLRETPEFDKKSR